MHATLKCKVDEFQTKDWEKYTKRQRAKQLWQVEAYELSVGVMQNSKHLTAEANLRQNFQRQKSHVHKIKLQWKFAKNTST